MLQFILIAHNQAAFEALKTVHEIVRETTPITALGVGPEESIDSIQNKLAEALRSLPAESKVLILTDLYGATPSNVCESFLKKGRVAMLSGCNMPIVLKAATVCFYDDPENVAAFLREYGQSNIRVWEGV